MTDETTVLIRRPRWVQPIPEEPGRPLLVASAWAALCAVGATLLAAMAVALVGWYLADAGSHGQATGALRVGADGWLLGHGATVTAAGLPLGIMPLGITALLVLAGHRFGRRAGGTVTTLPDRARLVNAVLVAAVTYVLAALVIALLAGTGSTTIDLGQTVFGALLVGLAGVGSGIYAGTGRARARWETVPGHVRTVLEGVLTGAGLLLAVATVAVAVGLAVSFNEASTTIGALDLSFGNAVMLLLVSAALVPNAALLGVAFLAGPGFALGTGTSVTATAVTLGPLPAFPLLTAVPADGTPPAWLAAVYAVPVLAAAVAAGLAQRRYAVPAWDSAALRGFAAGVGAAVLTTLLIALAGGPMGTGRMAHIGAPLTEVAVVLVGGMGIGGLLGGLAVAFGQRRRARRDA